MHIRMIIAIIIFLVPIGGQAQDHSKPDILILTTGGTIASQTEGPIIDGASLVRAIPELAKHANIEVEEFSVIGSSKMTPAHWLALSKRINALFNENDDLAGVVVTHGTDTLEETAYFLNLTVKSSKPVVMTGSMRSSDEVSADGPANLINAVRVAGNNNARGAGVLVVFNENITAARDVWKTDNRRVDTFQGASGGHIGTVDPDGVSFFHRTLQSHTVHSEFDVSGLSELPNIHILSDYTGFKGDGLGQLIPHTIDGLVVRTFAGGRMSAGMLDGLEELARNEMITVVTSRVPEGRIVSAPDYPFDAVVSNGLQDNKARILLMLALTQTKNISEIKRIFDTY